VTNACRRRTTKGIWRHNVHGYDHHSADIPYHSL